MARGPWLHHRLRAEGARKEPHETRVRTSGSAFRTCGELQARLDRSLLGPL